MFFPRAVRTSSAGMEGYVIKTSEVPMTSEATLSKWGEHYLLCSHFVLLCDGEPWWRVFALLPHGAFSEKTLRPCWQWDLEVLTDVHESLWEHRRLRPLSHLPGRLCRAERPRE